MIFILAMVRDKSWVRITFIMLRILRKGGDWRSRETFLGTRGRSAFYLSEKDIRKGNSLYLEAPRENLFEKFAYLGWVNSFSRSLLVACEEWTGVVLTKIQESIDEPIQVSEV
jgi:hypothetical protein